jgi:hypothetical protein
MATKTQTKRVSISKQKLAKQAEAVEEAAVGLAIEGAVEMEEGKETLETGRVAVRLAAAEMAAGASDLTRAEDALLAASRMADLSDVVEAAGAVDMAQGVELLAESEDVKTIGAIISLLSLDDLTTGWRWRGWLESYPRWAW